MVRYLAPRRRQLSPLFRRQIGKSRLEFFRLHGFDEKGQLVDELFLGWIDVARVGGASYQGQDHGNHQNRVELHGETSGLPAHTHSERSIQADYLYPPVSLASVRRAIGS